MTFGAPLLLLLLLPLAAIFWLTRRRGGLLLSHLPGHWDRIVEPGLRAFLARRIPERSKGQLTLCLAISVLLVLALARPGIETEDSADYGNLSGRVIVLDLGAGIDVRDQRLFAQRLLEASPGVPAAVVAVSGDAFDIVPLTTDQAQVSRYLQVLHPSMMPAPGRALNLGAAHGEAVLERAGVVAGQVVLVTGGVPPRPPRGGLPRSCRSSARCARGHGSRGTTSSTSSGSAETLASWSASCSRRRISCAGRTRRTSS